MSNDSNFDYSKYDYASVHILNYIVNADIKNPRILDVGCWVGALGEQIKSHKVCEIDGIDINKQALAKTQCYRNLYCIDLNNPDFSSLNQKYDFIVFGDVLEHTINPDIVINMLKSKLAENGFMAISLPNIGFLWYRLLHLFGYWDYKETGVMDKTHLRFFTLNSMQKFLQTNQLRIIRIDPYIGIKNRHFIIRNTLRFLAEIWPGLFALQVVFLVDIHK
jgi:2-polyprenyl-3-methyl-5-hydroxy-6-metoxy-1,4-benzoquinol methylase